ncbi:MAG: hypothetical protein HY830_02835 [Actinobacteria bacterium]|nr:hypothetical protein [Actinomycetota bacterium]
MTHMSAPIHTSATTREARTADQRSRWTRFLDAVAPAPSPNRLVPVAEISRDSLYFVEECLADVGLRAVIQPVGSMPGTTGRFRVLVAARDRDLASQVVGVA